MRLRVLGVDDWADWRELRLEALRDAPHAFGAKLADWQGDGDAEERWRERLGGGLLNLLAYLGDRPAGMVSGMPTASDGTAALISTWVAPFARGRGVGDALVGAVLRWADERGSGRVVLRVEPGNDWAIELYRRHGFRDIGLPGGLLVRFPVESWLTPRADVRQSAIEGLGLFAVEPIGEGEVVMRLGGQVIDDAALAALVPPYSSVTVASGYHLLLDPAHPVRYGNHSCDPTLRHVDATTLVALADIGVGEELTIDYATHTGVGSWSMACRCGSSGCRGTVTGSVGTSFRNR